MQRKTHLKHSSRYLCENVFYQRDSCQRLSSSRRTLKQADLCTGIRLQHCRSDAAYCRRLGTIQVTLSALQTHHFSTLSPLTITSNYQCLYSIPGHFRHFHYHAACLDKSLTHQCNAHLSSICIKTAVMLHNWRGNHGSLNALCWLLSCKNRPAPFPGRMSWKATNPGSICPVC